MKENQNKKALNKIRAFFVFKQDRISSPAIDGRWSSSVRKINI